MIAFIIILILSCFISFFIIKSYNMISLKNQTENFKVATYIYMSKKMDLLSKLMNELRPIVGETDDVIKLIKLRNEYNESETIQKNMNNMHEINKIIGIVFTDNKDLINNEELSKLKNELYSIDNSLRENSSLYIEAAKNYNQMLEEKVCEPVVKLFNYTKEEL